MKSFLIFSITALMVFVNIGCGDDSDNSYLKNSETFFQLNEEEQAMQAPTQLFRAIYLNDEALFAEQIPNLYLDFKKKNAEGDTALAVAIKLQRVTFINQMVALATFEDLKTSNKDERSFVSLLAEYNFESAFDIVGEKYLQQSGPIQTLLTNFSHVDFPDSHNMIAAHYVQSASFLDKLEAFWFYGFADTRHPWNGFYFTQDEHGDNFLMKAAQYNKVEILSWFVNRHCGQWGGESNDWWGIFGIAVRTGTFVSRKGTEYLQDFDYFPIERSYINITNTEGNSALHLAAKNGNARAVELIMQCEQVDPSMQNENGQVALTYMLSQLDPELLIVGQNYKDIFEMLIEQIDPLWSLIPFNNFNSLVNTTDHMGFSAVHYAARISDPYFYNAIRKYEQPTPDGNGIIPRDRQR